MNRLIILLIVLICYGNSLRAQEIEYSRPVNTPESCTSILVGKKASNAMNRLIILLIVLICYGNSLRAQEIEYSRPVNTPESCTSILVGKKASADGSVMTSHTCDGN